MGIVDTQVKLVSLIDKARQDQSGTLTVTVWFCGGPEGL